MVDIHKYKTRLKRTLQRVKESEEISERNKELILKYNDYCSLEGLSDPKIERYVYDAFRLAHMIQKDLDKATEDDLKSLVADIQRKEWTEHTKYTFKIGLRKFYRFIDGLSEKGKSPERLKWMKTKIKKSQVKLPDDLLTEGEIDLMVRHAMSERDRAFIFSLYESGCRIGELGSLKIKDVLFDECGVKIQVHGKTGSRVVRLVNCSPYLRNWLNNHPTSNERKSFLWTDNQGRLISHSRMVSILKQAAKRAGIKKRIYPHLFRHSRATHLASYLTEAQMKNYLGWDQSSDMAATYVHLNGKETNDAILKMNGLKSEDKKEESKLKPKKCSRCENVNKATSNYCEKCGLPLNQEEAEKIRKKDIDEQRTDEMMNKLMEDPDVKELIKKKLGS